MICGFHSRVGGVAGPTITLHKSREDASKPGQARIEAGGADLRLLMGQAHMIGSKTGATSAKLAMPSHKFRSQGLR